MYIVPTGCLVVIGASTLFAIWYQAKKTAEAAKAAADSVEAINKQSEVMRYQANLAEHATKAAQDNAVAAKDGAEATKQSIEMLISKERARVSVIPGSLTLSLRGTRFPFTK